MGNANPIKLGKCFQFLNDWYRFEHGGDRKSSDKICHLKENGHPQNQDELVDAYGIARTTMNNYMRLASMILKFDKLVVIGRNI